MASRGGGAGRGGGGGEAGGLPQLNEPGTEEGEVGVPLRLQAGTPGLALALAAGEPL